MQFDNELVLHVCQEFLITCKTFYDRKEYDTSLFIQYPCKSCFITFIIFWRSIDNYDAHV